MQISHDSQASSHLDRPMSTPTDIRTVPQRIERPVRSILFLMGGSFMTGPLEPDSELNRIKSKAPCLSLADFGSGAVRHAVWRRRLRFRSPFIAPRSHSFTTLVQDGSYRRAQQADVGNFTDARQTLPTPRSISDQTSPSRQSRTFIEVDATRQAQILTGLGRQSPQRCSTTRSRGSNPNW